MARLPKWLDQARCRQEDVRLFIPPKGRPRLRAKQLCADCPVREFCLERALTSPWPPSGIWGGLSESQLTPLWHQRHPESVTRAEIQQALGI